MSLLFSWLSILWSKLTKLDRTDTPELAVAAMLLVTVLFSNSSGSKKSILDRLNFLMTCSFARNGERLNLLNILKCDVRRVSLGFGVVTTGLIWCPSGNPILSQCQSAIFIARAWKTRGWCQTLPQAVLSFHVSRFVFHLSQLLFSYFTVNVFTFIGEFHLTGEFHIKKVKTIGEFPLKRENQLASCFAEVGQAPGVRTVLQEHTIERAEGIFFLWACKCWALRN